MNRFSKLSRYVYQIPNAFIGRISQAESGKLASVVKPKKNKNICSGVSTLSKTFG